MGDTATALSFLVVSATIALLLEVGSVDGKQDQDFTEPGGAPEQAAVPATPPPQQRWGSPIMSVVERHEAELVKIEGVHGVAVTRTPIGDDAIRVDVEDDSVRERLPDEIEGYPVEVVVVPGGFGILPAGSPHAG